MRRRGERAGREVYPVNDDREFLEGLNRYPMGTGDEQRARGLC